MEPVHFTIGTLARQAGVSVQTLRFYERKGLVRPAFRRSNGYRVYAVASVLRVGAIKQAQRLGFGLAEIRELLSLGPNLWDHPKGRASLEKKLEEIRNRIGHLKLLEARLQAWQAPPLQPPSGDAPWNTPSPSPAKTTPKRS